jgi:hypothetical protein
MKQGLLSGIRYQYQYQYQYQHRQRGDGRAAHCAAAAEVVPGNF